MSHRVWTAEDDEQLIALKRSGLSFAEISRLYGTTRNAIQGRLYRATGAHSRRKIRTSKPSSNGLAGDTKGRRNKQIVPAKYPYAPDTSCPDFAWDDDHCAAAMATGGFPAMKLGVAR